MEAANNCWHGIQEDPDLAPQLLPLADQVCNDAGGYSYQVEDMTLLRRFLILGTSDLVYYNGARHTQFNRLSVPFIERLIMNGRSIDAISCIREISLAGRNHKQSPLLYALAICARSNDSETKNLAYKFLPDICRTPTHLFQFIVFCKKVNGNGKGWGRAHKRGINEWYNSYKDDPVTLAYKITKCRKRHRMTHLDVVRLAHVRPTENAIRLIIDYIVKGITNSVHERVPPQAPTDNVDTLTQVQQFLDAVEIARSCNDENQLVSLIVNFNLAKEHIPTQMLRSADIWQALLWRMPLTVMIRNLGKMSALCLFNANTENERTVVRRLQDRDRLQTARIHPFAILVALNQYKNGRNRYNRIQWHVNRKIIRALEEAFHLSFANLEPTGKRILLAVDISSTMDTPLIGCPQVTAREAAAAMMMVTARTEPSTTVCCFANDLTMIPNDRLLRLETTKEALNELWHISFAADCSRPITYAIEKKKVFDVFIVYTDSLTNFGNIHPADAMTRYRSAFGIDDARLIVVGMSSNKFSIANPQDPYTMNVVGFDPGAPSAMSQFIRGQI